MAAWKFASIIMAVSIGTAAHAQVDWGPIIQSEAMGSAVEEAGRETAPSQTRPPRAPVAAASVDAERAKAKANCARARGWAANGVRDARLPQILGLCKQLGY